MKSPWNGESSIHRRSELACRFQPAMKYVVHTRDVPGGVPCRVIAKLQPKTWRVIVGVGVGQLDGGIEHDWAEDDLPHEARRPNATFFVTLAR